MQYSSYKSSKDVLKDIRNSKINKILTNLSSQGLIVKSLWNESFNENIEHWYTSFQNLPKNIYNFSTLYINKYTSHAEEHDNVEENLSNTSTCSLRVQSLSTRRKI